MRSKRAGAFEDAALDESEQQHLRYERALRLLDGQAQALMNDAPTSDDACDAQHAPHNPHRRPLSSAARRLVRAHERLEHADDD